MDQGDFHSYISLLFSDQGSHTCVVFIIAFFLLVSMKTNIDENMIMILIMEKLLYVPAVKMSKHVSVNVKYTF